MSYLPAFLDIDFAFRVPKDSFFLRVPRFTFQCSCSKVHVPMFVFQGSHSNVRVPRFTFQGLCPNVCVPRFAFQGSHSEAHVPRFGFQGSCSKVRIPRLIFQGLHSCIQNFASRSCFAFLNRNKFCVSFFRSIHQVTSNQCHSTYPGLIYWTMCPPPSPLLLMKTIPLWA